MSKPTTGDFTKTAGWLDWYSGPSKPKFQLPAGAVDAHCHVFGPGAEFPTPRAQVHPCDASKHEALRAARCLGFARNVVVQATCHGADNRAMVDACLSSGGRRAASRPSSAASVTLNCRRCTTPACAACASTSSSAWSTSRQDELLEIAGRIAKLGWHVVIYFEAVDLPELWDFFTALPTTVVVDHMGRRT